MVRPRTVYLFVGQDCPAKDAALDQIKKQHLPQKHVAHFNLDVLFGKEVGLKEIQEKLLFYPLQSGKRVVVLKDVQEVKKEVQEFLAGYSSQPSDSVVLIMDARSGDIREGFLASLAAHAVTTNFPGVRPLNVFDLCRVIESRQAAASLRVLDQLIKKGEKPELILGGLRARMERECRDRVRLRTVIRLLLQCDSSIKTGASKPVFALEKLVVSLCRLQGFQG